MFRNRIWIDMVITTKPKLWPNDQVKPDNIFWRNNLSNYYPGIKWNISGGDLEKCITLELNKPIKISDYDCECKLKYICGNSKDNL